MELGDAVEAALKQVGLTKERLAPLLGPDCGCEARREKLNRLSRWARMSARVGVDAARKHLLGLFGPKHTHSLEEAMKGEEDGRKGEGGGVSGGGHLPAGEPSPDA